MAELDIKHHIDEESTEKELSSNHEATPAHDLHGAEAGQEFIGLDKSGREKDIRRESVSYIVSDEQFRHLGADHTFSSKASILEFSSPVNAVRAAYGARQQHAEELEGEEVRVHKVVDGEIILNPSFRTLKEPILLKYSWSKISDQPLPDEVKDIQRDFNQGKEISITGAPSYTKSVKQDQNKQIQENDLRSEPTTARSFQISLTRNGQDKPFSTTDVTVSHDLDDKQTKATLSEEVKKFAMSRGGGLKGVSAKVVQQKDVEITPNQKELNLGRGFGENF